MAGPPMRDKSSLITSLMLRIDSPRITFFTSSKSSVSCSMSARASYACVLQHVTPRQINIEGTYPVQLLLFRPQKSKDPGLSGLK